MIGQLSEFSELLKKYKGQTILIRCPICGWEQVADRAYYEIGKRHIGHPYTCVGHEGAWHDNVEMEAVDDPD